MTSCTRGTGVFDSSAVLPQTVCEGRPAGTHPQWTA